MKSVPCCQFCFYSTPLCLCPFVCLPLLLKLLSTFFSFHVCSQWIDAALIVTSVSSHANGEGNVYLRDGGQAGEGGRVQHFLYRYMALSRSDSILLHYVFFLFLFLKLYFASSKKINLDSFGSRKQ